MFSASLRQHRVDHLHDELLLGAWQLVDALDLQLQLAHGSALVRTYGCADEAFDGDVQRMGDHRQAGDLDAPASGPVSGDGLLGRLPSWAKKACSSLPSATAMGAGVEWSIP